MNERPILHLPFSTDTGARKSPFLPSPAPKPKPTTIGEDRQVTQTLLDAVRDVPHLPKNTRRLRLTLAAIDAMPKQTPNLLTYALKQVKGYDCALAEEVRKAIYESLMNAQMQRHRELVESTLAYVSGEARPDREARIR